MQKKIPERKEEFVKLLMNRVIHECIKEEPNIWEKKWTKLSKILSLNLIKRHGYQKRRYVRKLNSDLIGFVGLKNTLSVFYFEYLTDEKCSRKKSEILVPTELGGEGGMEEEPT